MDNIRNQPGHRPSTPHAHNPSRTKIEKGDRSYDVFVRSAPTPQVDGKEGIGQVGVN